MTKWLKSINCGKIKQVNEFEFFFLFYFLNKSNTHIKSKRLREKKKKKNVSNVTQWRVQIYTHLSQGLLKVKVQSISEKKFAVY